MVMINTTMNEMNVLIKKRLTRKDYEDICFRYGIDIEGDDNYLNFELTSDRIELASKFSLAWLIGQLINVKVHRTETVLAKKLSVNIENTHRPFVNLLYVKLTEPLGNKIKELLTLQDKFDKTVGRNRHSAAIGIFDFSKIKFPIEYREDDPAKISFTPLDSASPKSFEEIMTNTEKGRMYKNLIKNRPIVWRQADEKIFAMPPIINADFSSVTNTTKSLLVDITGNNKETVNALTKALIFNLQFFGEVTVIKPTYSDKKNDPNLNFKQNKFFLDNTNISNLLGENSISLKEASRILKTMDYKVFEEKSGLIVLPPFYRQDVIHQVDVIDDILRFYGVQNIKPIESNLYTLGSKLRGSESIENIRSLIVGFGYQELDLNILTNEEYQFKKTGILAENYAALIDQKSGDITMARANLLPELLRTISNNLHKKFPQSLFDIGFVLKKSGADVMFSNELHLCMGYCGLTSNLSDILVVLRKLLKDTFGDEKLSIHSDEKSDGFEKMFIKGRGGSAYFGNKKIGVVGEVHPRVLNEFGIELPTSVAEINIEQLLL